MSLGLDSVTTGLTVLFTLVHDGQWNVSSYSHVSDNFPSCLPVSLGLKLIESRHKLPFTNRTLAVSREEIFKLSTSQHWNLSINPLGTTCHARREFFVPNCNIFSVSNMFKCIPGKANDKFITSCNNFCPVTSHRRSKENESDELLYTVQSLVMVRATG